MKPTSTITFQAGLNFLGCLGFRSHRLNITKTALFWTSTGFSCIRDFWVFTDV